MKNGISTPEDAIKSVLGKKATATAAGRPAAPLLYSTMQKKQPAVERVLRTAKPMEMLPRASENKPVEMLPRASDTGKRAMPVFDRVRSVANAGVNIPQAHFESRATGVPLPFVENVQYEENRLNDYRRARKPMQEHLSALEQDSRETHFTKTAEAKETRSETVAELRGKIKELGGKEKQSERAVMEAKRRAEAGKYAAIAGLPDFKVYAERGASVQNPSMTDAEVGIAFGSWRPFSEKVGNIVTYSRENFDTLKSRDSEEATGVGDVRYHYMTEDEVGVYNYLLAKEGAESAQKYLGHIEEELNYRMGTEQGENIRGVENGVGRSIATGIYGLGAGTDQFVSGAQQFFSKERLPTSPTQFGSGYIREDLKDSGPEVLGRSLGQLGYDLTTTVGNMAPSLMIGGIGGVGAGAASMGMSSSGNAYNRALDEGYTENEARSYATLVGASEGALQYLLGGISKLGGKVTGSIAQKTIQNIDNALLRAATDLGVNMVGEGTEEYLQEVLEPVFRNIAFDERNEMQFVSEDAAYSFIMGALTAGVMEMPGAVGRARGGGTETAGAESAPVQEQAGVNPSTAQGAVPLPLTREAQEQGTGNGGGMGHAALPTEIGQQKTASMGETAGAYRAVQPENVEMPTVPIINLSMNEVAELSGGTLPRSGNQLRKTAMERAVSRLGLDKGSAAYVEASNVTRSGDTYVLKITKDSLYKMLSASSYQGAIVPLESIAVIENLERIANNGVYYRSEGDRKGRDQIAGFDHLMTTVYIDNVPYVVDMRVRVYDEKSGGENRLYHFTPEAVQVTKQSDRTSPTGTLHERTIESEKSLSLSDTTISPDGGGVKGQGAPMGGGVFMPGSGIEGQDASPAAQNDRGARGDGGKRKVEAETALNKLLTDLRPTEEEFRIAKGMADGVYSMERMLPGMDENRIQEIADAIRVRDSFNKRSVKEQQGQETGGVDLQAETGMRDVIGETTRAIDDFMNATLERKTADVLTEMPGGPERTIREALESGGQELYRKLVDSGEAVGRIGRELGDNSLYAYYNYARASSNAAGHMLTKGGAQIDVLGNEVGKSLSDIFEPIRAKGQDYYRDFESYLFHRHNVDRMSRDNSVAIEQAKFDLDDFDERNPDVARMTEGDLSELARLGDYAASERMNLLNAYNRAKKVVNKPVFGHDVSAMDSVAESARLARANPEFAELADEVYQYNRNQMQYRVDSGLLTREQADRIETAYPHYVPTYRLTDGELARAKRKGKRVSSTIGRAQGGTSDLMPIHVAMARQTMQVVRNGAINRLGGRLLEDYEKNRDAGAKYIYDVSRAENEAHPDYFDLLDDPTPKKDNTFTVYRDGEAVQMTVDKGLYEGISALTPSKEGVMNASFWKLPAAATSLFKALVTGYNPMFSARNFARDFQEAGLYSKDLGAWAKNYPLAVKEIAKNGDWWRRYQALGGVYSSVFDYQQGYALGEKDHGAVRRQTLDRVEGLNMAIEQAPRLAEFMAQVKKNGDTQDAYMDAMLAAANVTTNFGRSGEVGKFLNRTFVPFLNPSIQGIDKAARTFLGKKDGKAWLKLIARVAVFGILPALINELVNEDEPWWDDVRQSDKDVNWLIGIGDGRYIKIPKGRDMSVAVMTVDRVGDMIRGEEVDWGEVGRTAVNQLAPPNPLENNIIGAWADADLLDPESPGKTWYGGNIENQRLQGYAPGKRFDEDTDVISKAVGGALGVSPKKLNYILDQYSGVVGDFVLPLLTPSGDKNPLAPFSKAFVLDSVNSNRISGEFYDKTDEMTYAKNGGDGAMAVVLRFWNKQAGAVSDVYAQIREKENGRMLPNATMLEQVRQDKSVINGIQKNAMDVLPEYEAAVRKFYTGDSDKEKDETYRKANREVFGAEYALQVYNKDVYLKAAVCDGRGVDYDKFYDTYFALQEAGGDGEGATQRKREALLGVDGLTPEQKTTLGKYVLGDSRKIDYSSKDALTISMMDEGSRGKAEAAINAGIDGSVFLSAYEAQKDAKGDKDAKGNTIALTASRNKKNAIDTATPDMSREQRELLYEMFGVSEKVWGERGTTTVQPRGRYGMGEASPEKGVVKGRYGDGSDSGAGAVSSSGSIQGRYGMGGELLPRGRDTQSSGGIVGRYGR